MLTPYKVASLLAIHQLGESRCVDARDEDDTPLCDGASGFDLLWRADLVHDDDVWALVLHSLSHYGRLGLGLGLGLGFRSLISLSHACSLGIPTGSHLASPIAG